MEMKWKVFTSIAGAVTLSGLLFMSYLVIEASKDAGVEPLKVALPKAHTVMAAGNTYEPEPVLETAVIPGEVTNLVEEDAEESKKINILLLGVDSRGDDLVGRTDTMIVLQLDKENNTTTMISIPRDSYVNIIGKGKKDKITHAYSFGGLDMATETVEELLEIDIDHHLVLNFSSFTSIIDTLGGIEVEVPFAFSEQDSKGVKNAITFEEGTHILDGEEALAFARMRKQDPRGDIGRGERQQQVITAVVSKLLSIGSVPKYGTLFGEVKDGIDTDVNILDIPKLAPYLSTFSEINPVSLEGEGIKLNGVYYYQLNENTLYNAKQELN